MKLVSILVLLTLGVSVSTQGLLAQDAPSGTVLETTSAEDNVLFHMGEQKFAQMDAIGAIKDFDRAIAINPKLKQAYYLRGACKHILHDYKGAVDDCTVALQLDPNDAVFYMQRAIAEYRLSMFDKAIDDCTRGINLKPTFAQNYIYRGFCRFEKGDMNGAMDDCENALRINPDDANARTLARKLCWTHGPTT